MPPSVEVDCADPCVVVKVFMKDNPHDLILASWKLLDWACKELDIDDSKDRKGVKTLKYLLRYFKEFRKCPDSTTTLKTWIASNTKNDQNSSREYVMVAEDIDEVDSLEVDVLPSVEVTFDTFMVECNRVAADNTFHVATKLNGGSTPPKYLEKFAETHTPTEVAFQWVQRRRDKMPSQVVTKPLILGKDAQDVMEYYEEQLNKPKIDIGIPMINLAHESLFMGILATNKHGKSSFSRFLSLRAAMEGMKVLHITLETEQQKEANQWAVCYAHSTDFPKEFRRISYENFDHNTLNATDKEHLALVTEKMKTWDNMVLIENPQEGCTWPELKEKIQRYIDQYGVRLVNLDYIQLIQLEGNPNDLQKETKEMITDIKRFVTKNKIILISSIQANSEGQAKAEKNQFCWSASAVLEWKELARSMELMIGIWNFHDPLNDGSVLTQINFVPDGSRAPYTGAFVQQMQMTAGGYFIPFGADEVRVPSVLTKPKAKPTVHEQIMKDFVEL